MNGNWGYSLTFDSFDNTDNWIRDDSLEYSFFMTQTVDSGVLADLFTDFFMILTLVLWMGDGVFTDLLAFLMIH